MSASKRFLAVASIYFVTMISNVASAALLDKIHQDLSASITLDTNTNYIFRGVTVVDDPVFQPDVSVSLKYLTLGMWQNVLLSEAVGEGGVGTAPATNEIDYYADLTYEYNTFSGSFGWIYYDFPHTPLPDTQELYFGFGACVPLNPSVTMYWDVADNAGGLYWLFSLSQDINVATLTVTPSLGLGVSNTRHTSYYAGVDMDSAHIMDLNLGLNIGVPLGGIMEKVNGTMNLHLNYSIFPDSSMRHEIEKLPDSFIDKDAFYMGAGLSFEF
jgi:hypothetical protein